MHLLANYWLSQVARTVEVRFTPTSPAYRVKLWRCCDVAVLATALFTGAAAYVSLVEHPARLRCANEIGVVSPRTNPLRTCIEYMQVVTLAWLTMRVRIVRTAVRQLRHAAKRVRRGIGPGVD